MWVVHLALSLAALYAAIITGMFFAQTWLLFPTVLAGVGRVQLPASSHLLKVRTPDGETLAGVRIPSGERRPMPCRRCLASAGTPGTPRRRPSPCMHYFLIAASSRSTTAVMRRAAAPSARALFSDSLMIFDHLARMQAGERFIPVGFSIGVAVAAYLGQHRPVAGMILVTPLNSLEAAARDLYWWAPVGLFSAIAPAA